MEILNTKESAMIYDAMHYDAMLHRAAEDKTFRDAIIATRDDILRLKFQQKENFTMKVLDEELFTMFFGMAFSQHHFLYKPFNNIILRVVQSGLIDKWFKEHYGDKWTEGKKVPVVLTWEHLYVGFYIYLVCLALSTAEFLVEILYFRVNVSIR